MYLTINIHFNRCTTSICFIYYLSSNYASTNYQYNLIAFIQILLVHTIRNLCNAINRDYWCLCNKSEYFTITLMSFILFNFISVYYYPLYMTFFVNPSVYLLKEFTVYYANFLVSHVHMNNFLTTCISP